MAWHNRIALHNDLWRYMSKSREQVNDYLKRIDIQGKIVLDVGVQDHPTSRLTRGEAERYYTLDIDPQWKPDVVADLNDPDFKRIVQEAIKRPAPSPLKHIFEADVDTIFCIEVLEHCWNPVQAVTNLASIMANNGDLYITTPFINPHHDVVDYLRYTNEWYRDVLPKVGLDVVQIIERVSTVGRDLLMQFYTIEGMKISRIRPEYGRYTYPVGYIVHAKRRLS